MRRRDFAVGLAGMMLAGSRSVHAQQGLPRIGVLVPGSVTEPKRLSVVMELARLGHVEGRNIAFEIRAADGDIGRFPALARELVAEKPVALVTASTAAALALAQVTPDIPIVVTVTIDPIASGLSDSIARPSRNITGFTSSSPTLAAKRVQLLHQLVTDLRRIGHLSVPLGAAYEIFRDHIQAAAEAFGIVTVNMPVTAPTAEGVSDAFRIADGAELQAVLVGVHPAVVRMSGYIIDECLVRNLPSIHPWSFETQLGALMSYGPVTVENVSGAARYVDRILKGATVAELPFEEPTEIRLAINLRTARSMKIIVPPTLLASADDVIE